MHERPRKIALLLLEHGADPRNVSVDDDPRIKSILIRARAEPLCLALLEKVRCLCDTGQETIGVDFHPCPDGPRLAAVFDEALRLNDDDYNIIIFLCAESGRSPVEKRSTHLQFRFVFFSGTALFSSNFDVF
jgi:hypothetical protein